MESYHIVVYDENSKLEEFDRDFNDVDAVNDFVESEYSGLGVITEKN